jgi:hypothetical protein
MLICIESYILSISILSAGLIGVTINYYLKQRDKKKSKYGHLINDGDYYMSFV